MLCVSCVSLLMVTVYWHVSHVGVIHVIPVGAAAGVGVLAGFHLIGRAKGI